MAAAPMAADNGQPAAQQPRAAQQQDASAAGPHMVSKTILPPSCYEFACAGNFTGAPDLLAAAAAAAMGSADAATSTATAAAGVATQVVLATSTSLLLLAISPAEQLTPAAVAVAELPQQLSADALAASNRAAAKDDMAMDAPAEQQQGEEEAEEAAAPPAAAVMCEQPVFGRIEAVAAMRHPYASGSQGAAQDLLLLLLAHSTHLLVLRYDAAATRFVTVALAQTALDGRGGSAGSVLGSDGRPAQLAVASDGSAVAVAPRRGDPVVLRAVPGSALFSQPVPVPLSAEVQQPTDRTAALAAAHLVPDAGKPWRILSLCFADAGGAAAGEQQAPPPLMVLAQLPGCNMLWRVEVVPALELEHCLVSLIKVAKLVPRPPGGRLPQPLYAFQRLELDNPLAVVPQPGDPDRVLVIGSNMLLEVAHSATAACAIARRELDAKASPSERAACEALPTHDERMLCAAWGFGQLTAAGQDHSGDHGAGKAPPPFFVANAVGVVRHLYGYGPTSAATAYPAVAHVEGRPKWLLPLPGGRLLVSARGGGADLIWQSALPNARSAPLRRMVLPGGGSVRQGQLLVADLEGLSQPQAYAVCTGASPSEGAVRVMYPNPVPEVVFESAPDYTGVTGLWAVAAQPSAADHALVVLSFVSGSRALSTAGAALSDATDAVGLAADECTVTAGCIGHHIAAQVTATRIQLCSLAAVCGGSGSGTVDVSTDDADSPRPHMGKRQASWATMEGISDAFASRLLPFSSGEGSSGSLPSPSRRREPLPPLFSTLTGAASGESNDGMLDSWRPPGGGSISVAAVVHGLVFFSCAGEQVLTAVAVQRLDRRSGDNGSGSGKRKRASSGSGRTSWCLAPVAATSVAAELSCITAAPLPGCQQGSVLVAVGTHEPAIELLLARPAVDGRGSGLPSLMHIARLCLAPQSGLSPPEQQPQQQRTVTPRQPPRQPPAGLPGLAGPAATTVAPAMQPRDAAGFAAGAAAAADVAGLSESIRGPLGLAATAGNSHITSRRPPVQHDISESLQLLAAPTDSQQPLKVMVGLRSGALLQAALLPAARGTCDADQDATNTAETAETVSFAAASSAVEALANCELTQVGHSQTLGSLPIDLVPLPPFSALSGDLPPPSHSAVGLALGERPWLLTAKQSVGSGGSISRGSGGDSGIPSHDCNSPDSASAGERIAAQPLCADRITRAAALALPASDGSSSARSLVLGASGDGRLRLLDLSTTSRWRQLPLLPPPPPPPPPIGCGFPLPPELGSPQLLTPCAMPDESDAAANGRPFQLAVACAAATAGGSPSVVVADPVTGEVAARCQLADGETITCLVSWQSPAISPGRGADADAEPTCDPPQPASSAQPEPDWQQSPEACQAYLQRQLQLMRQAVDSVRQSVSRSDVAAALQQVATLDQINARLGQMRQQGAHFAAGVDLQAAIECLKQEIGNCDAMLASLQREAQEALGRNGNSGSEVTEAAASSRHLETFIAVGTACKARRPQPWHSLATVQGRLLLLRLTWSQKEGCSLVVEEVLQLSNAVASIAAAPGFCTLFVAVGPVLAGYSLARRRVLADSRWQQEAGGAAAAGRSGRAGSSGSSVVAYRTRLSGGIGPMEEEEVSSQPAGVTTAPRQPPPPKDGWAFESRRRRARTMPGGSSSFDTGGGSGMEAGDEASTGHMQSSMPGLQPAQAQPQECVEHWGLERRGWRRFPAPLTALNIDPSSGQLAVANARHSVSLLTSQPSSEQRFEVLRADRHSRPVTSCLVMLPQNWWEQPAAADGAAGATQVCVDCGQEISPMDAACVAVGDARGGLAVLRADQAHKGPEANLDAGCHFGCGSPVTALSPGGFAFEGLSTDAAAGGAASDGAAAAGSCQLDEGFVAATSGGALVATAPVAPELHRLLEAVEAAISSDASPTVAPIAGGKHADFRSGGNASGSGSPGSAKAVRMLDGDLLQTFLHLPPRSQQEVAVRVMLALGEWSAAELPSPGAAAQLSSLLAARIERLLCDIV